MIAFTEKTTLTPVGVPGWNISGIDSANGDVCVFSLHS